ncbi:hypothetical protein WA026_005354 [Henosepilachna vigintioctopunctata]|uniref:Uncharacterized protein n=1 Tax=Henosepilachna vigintioctopunctata TaxID=420089 RepID=A0AAW1TW11_9CUCU
MERSIQKLFKDRYPMLGDAKEDTEIIEQITRRRRQEGEVKQKIIKMTYEEGDKEIWKMLENLRKETLEDEKIAIHYIAEMSIDRFRKMVEAIFVCSITKVMIFTNKQEERNKTTRNIKERDTYALIVETQKEGYENTLRKGIRSTKEGNLLITLEKNEEAITDIRTSIRNQYKDLRVRQLGGQGPKDTGMETITIRGLDALNVREEVVKAVENKLGQDQGNYKLEGA